jgi:hypothetical protein
VENVQPPKQLSDHPRWKVERGKRLNELLISFQIAKYSDELEIYLLHNATEPDPARISESK